MPADKRSWIDRLFSLRSRAAPVPQLIMWYRSAEAPKQVDLDGYSLRTYESGDEQGWLNLLVANGELGIWDRERLDGVLAETHVQFFVECEGQIIACTGVNDRLRDVGPCWEIGWVAVHPDFQGRRIGAFIIGGAVAKALQLGSRPIYLLTDDFRVPALRSYLKLGFEPDGTHPSYRDRWGKIFAHLGSEYQKYQPEFIRGGGS